MLGRWISFTFGKVTFQGGTVKLQVGMPSQLAFLDDFMFPKDGIDICYIEATNSFFHRSLALPTKEIGP